MDPKIYVVCSDRARNGKTLLGRLYADYLTAMGRPPFVLDADNPGGRIIRWYPDTSKLVDISKVQGQMAMFDTVLTHTGRDYVIDLPARHLIRFCNIVDELDMLQQVRDAGFELVMLYIVEPSMESLGKARDIRNSFSLDRFVAIRNEAFGDLLGDYRMSRIYFEISADGDLALPFLPPQVMRLVEGPDFSFMDYMIGDMDPLPEEIGMPLRDALNVVLSQMRQLQLKIDMKDLRRMGLV